MLRYKYREYKSTTKTKYVVPELELPFTIETFLQLCSYLNIKVEFTCYEEYGTIYDIRGDICGCIIFYSPNCKKIYLDCKGNFDKTGNAELSMEIPKNKKQLKQLELELRKLVNHV